MGMLTGKHIPCYCIICFTVLLSYSDVHSQKSDSTGNSLPPKQTTFLQFLLKPITRSGTDSLVPSGKNEVSFLPYEGKIIRHIQIKEFGFEKTRVIRRQQYVS